MILNAFNECRICVSYRTYERVEEDMPLLHSHELECAKKELKNIFNQREVVMSDMIRTAGDNATITPWDYIAMVDRIRGGDYTDLPKIFCVTPAKLIGEMNIEELVNHRLLMETAIRFLRTMVNVVVVQENALKSGMSDEETTRCMEYETKHAPKARAAIQERAVVIKAEDELVIGFMKNGMSRKQAEGMVSMLKHADE